MNSTLGKVLGWISFLSVSAGTILNQTGTHGFGSILQAVGSLLAAAGIHAASSTNGTN